MILPNLIPGVINMIASYLVGIHFDYGLKGMWITKIACDALAALGQFVMV